MEENRLGLVLLLLVGVLISGVYWVFNVKPIHRLRAAVMGESTQQQNIIPKIPTPTESPLSIDSSLLDLLDTSTFNPNAEESNDSDSNNSEKYEDMTSITVGTCSFIHDGAQVKFYINKPKVALTYEKTDEVDSKQTILFDGANAYSWTFQDETLTESYSVDKDQIGFFLGFLGSDNSESGDPYSLIITSVKVPQGSCTEDMPAKSQFNLPEGVEFNSFSLTDLF